MITNTAVSMEVRYPPLQGLDVTAANKTIPIVFQCTRPDMLSALILALPYNVTLSGDGLVFRASTTGTIGHQPIGSIALHPDHAAESSFVLEARSVPAVCYASSSPLLPSPEESFGTRSVRDVDTSNSFDNVYYWSPADDAREKGGAHLYVVDYDYQPRPVVTPSGIVRFADQPAASAVVLPSDGFPNLIVDTDDSSSSSGGGSSGASGSGSGGSSSASGFSPPPSFVGTGSSNSAVDNAQSLWEVSDHWIRENWYVLLIVAGLGITFIFYYWFAFVLPVKRNESEVWKPI